MSDSPVVFDSRFEFENVPHLSERMLIDLVNGLEVSENQIIFKENQGLFSRVIGFFDGSNRRRQIMIEQQHQRSIESLKYWVEELTQHCTLSTRSIIEVGNKLIEVERDLKKFKEDIDERLNRQIEIFENFKEATDQKIYGLQKEVEVLSLDFQAHKRLDEVFEKWEAERIYKGYPPVVQLTFALDDLARGEIGRIIFRDYYQRISTRSAIILKRLHGINPGSFYSIKEWLKYYCEKPKLEKSNIAAYLLKASTEHEEAPLHWLIGEYVEDGILDLGKKDKSISRFYKKERLIDSVAEESKLSLG